MRGGEGGRVTKGWRHGSATRMIVMVVDGYSKLDWS
jgi:hypothetical protein